jgi:hypothetical protein
MGKSVIKESNNHQEFDREINATDIFMRDLRRSYPEFAQALEEFMKKELQRLDDELK